MGPLPFSGINGGCKAIIGNILGQAYRDTRIKGDGICAHDCPGNRRHLEERCCSCAYTSDSCGTDWRRFRGSADQPAAAAVCSAADLECARGPPEPRQNSSGAWEWQGPCPKPTSKKRVLG